MEPMWNDGRRFSGRVALVTGAGGTLGGAVAEGFGREGASVVVGYRSSREAAEAVVAGIVAAGGAAWSPSSTSRTRRRSTASSPKPTRRTAASTCS